MTQREFPPLDPAALPPTREALHAWSCVLGSWMKAARPRRKHWWHSSLRPSLSGLTTGVVRASPDFELKLDFLSSRLHVRTPGLRQSIDLVGQSAAEFAESVDAALLAAGIDKAMVPGDEFRATERFTDYDRIVASDMQRAHASVAAALEQFRAGIREETGDVQHWPHHFDLSMIWLPGDKIPGEDPADEEAADKQMNFGFSFGDDAIEEPYCYVTAYPLPDAFPGMDLPQGTGWFSDGFDGAVLLYADLVAMERPSQYLIGLWTRMLDAGRPYLATES